jgi:hypothetical protein
MQPPAPDWLNEIRQAEQFFDQKRFDEAAELAARALRKNPNAALGHQVQALVYVERLQFREAIPRLEQALSLRPDLVPCHNGLAQCYMHLDDLDRALIHLNTALCLDPNHAFAHFNRSLLWLKRGQYAEGWVEYEWRFAAGLVKRPDLPRPRWDGGSLENKAILIHTEQGLGDVLQFVRLLPLVRKRARRLIMACQKPMKSFLESLTCIDEYFPVDEPSEVQFDVCCPLLSLPALLRLDGTDYYSSVPYVYPDPLRVHSWGERMKQYTGFKIGLNWQGNPTFHGDKFRSIPLRYFAPLAMVPDVKLFSVQKGAGLDQIEPNRDNVPITVFPDLAQDGTFHDTASLMQHLDLIITSDTAVAHLAGALGRPVWVLLARNADWRWLIDRPDSPWYPSMRLFRQRTLGDWTIVFEQVVAALKERLAARVPPVAPTPALLDVPVSAAELLDLIASKEVERARCDDDARRTSLNAELERLHCVRTRSIPPSGDQDEWLARLKQLHAKIGDLDRDLRRREKAEEFGDSFLELARARTRSEEELASLKQTIEHAVATS